MAQKTTEVSPEEERGVQKCGAAIWKWKKLEHVLFLKLAWFCSGTGLTRDANSNPLSFEQQQVRSVAMFGPRVLPEKKGEVTCLSSALTSCPLVRLTS